MDGCDCWGLVKLIYERELGIILPGYEWVYSTTEDAPAISETINKEKSFGGWIQVPEGKEKEFDVALIRMDGLPMHVGVVNGNKRLLHVLAGTNSSNPKYNSLAWKNRILGFYRYAGTQ